MQYVKRTQRYTAVQYRGDVKPITDLIGGSHVTTLNAGLTNVAPQHVVHMQHGSCTLGTNDWVVVNTADPRDVSVYTDASFQAMFQLHEEDVQQHTTIAVESIGGGAGVDPA